MSAIQPAEPLVAPAPSAEPLAVPRAWRLGLAAFAVLGVLWFCGLELRGLFAPDESRYAEVAREMLVSGDWITPRLNGLKYFEKPPLQYWATAGIFALFGLDEWTARLWTALTGFAGALVVAFAGARLGPPHRGWLAGVIVASSWGYFFAGQFLTLDMGLTFFLTCALSAFLLAQRIGLDAREERAWMLAAWASLALAVLSKGPVGVVLAGLALAVYVATTRDTAVLRRLHVIPGLAVFLAIAAPWFLLVQARNPEFFQFFFVHEHLGRFALAGHNRPGPWWYFLPILVVGTMPWTPLLAAAVARRGSTPTGQGSRIDVDRFLLVWAGTVLVFFSVSSSKLPPYVLPMLPALALLAARRLPALEDRRAVGRAAAAAAAGAAVFAAGAVPVLATEKFAALASLLGGVPGWFVAADAALIAGAGAAWWLVRAGRVRAALLALAASSLAFGQLALGGAHAVDEFYSAERVVEKWLGDPPHLDDDAPFYSVGQFDPGLPFYLGRTVTLVAYQGELAPGIAAEPSKHVESVEAFEREWQAAERAYAEMDPARFEALAARGLTMRVLARDLRRVIVARH